MNIGDVVLLFKSVDISDKKTLKDILYSYISCIKAVKIKSISNNNLYYVVDEDGKLDLCTHFDTGRTTSWICTLDEYTTLLDSFKKRNNELLIEKITESRLLDYKIRKQLNKNK